MLVEDPLEGDLAVEFLVEGDEHGAQAAVGVRSQDAEAPAVVLGRADVVGPGAVGLPVLGRAAARADGAECRFDVRVAKTGQARGSIHRCPERSGSGPRRRGA